MDKEQQDISKLRKRHDNLCPHLLEVNFILSAKKNEEEIKKVKNCEEYFLVFLFAFWVMLEVCRDMYEFKRPAKAWNHLATTNEIAVFSITGNFTERPFDIRPFWRENLSQTVAIWKSQRRNGVLGKPFGKMSRGVHPAFHTKSVVKLECKYCEKDICARGMRALLLADTNVELYSTDFPPEK